jgi:L-alanine-DL-glutamate epimerase-like enolase superfamily enzyme
MAQRIAAALAPYDVRWIEDPVRPHDFQALDRVARATSIPIAVGETLGGKATLDRMMASAAIAVVIVDLAWAGGISEGREVADHARGRGLEVAFHDCTGPVGLAASTHLALSVPNAPVQEIVRAFYYGWYQDLVTDLPPIAAGRITAPQGPGLGLALQPDLLRRPGVSVQTSRNS